MKNEGIDKSTDNGKLRNYSEVSSFNRLVDPDENSSQLIAGGDKRTDSFKKGEESK